MSEVLTLPYFSENDVEDYFKQNCWNKRLIYFFRWKLELQILIPRSNSVILVKSIINRELCMMNFSIKWNKRKKQKWWIRV